MKIVINKKYGGFSLSHKAVLRYFELKGIPIYWKVDEIGIRVYQECNPNKNTKLLVHYGTDPKFMGEGNPGYLFPNEIPRNDPALIKVIEELGKDACTFASNLKIVVIPDEVAWEIEEYDGEEWVAEKHRTWD